MQHLQPNTTLQGGKYRIERMLGQGGFGITYLARNTVFDIDVAIKEFFMKDENDRIGSSVTMPNTTKQELFHGQMEKFKKEAKRMFAIKNEHVIGVQDLFEENGTAYYVMDYVDGENLAERLKRTDKPMSEQEVRAILLQILDALKSVHDAGIWHLDLKPANIMLDKAGNVKLIDFGASKQLNAQKGGATTSTAISYTNGYAPREQMEQNYDKFGPWTDIYALGATLFNLLTNKRPPLPSDIDDDISEDKHEALPFTSDTSDGMKHLVLKMMETNRTKRPKSIDSIEFPNIDDKVIQEEQNDETTIVGTRNEQNEEETIIAPSPKTNAPSSNLTEENYGLDTYHAEIDELISGEPSRSFWDKHKWYILAAIFLILIAIYIFTCTGNQTVYMEPENNNIEAVDSIDEEGAGKIYDVVEVMPQFPGGMDALVTYLQNNIVYPPEAEEKGIEGKVVLTFIVEPDGSITYVKVVSPVDKLLDAEAVRVIKTMPKWIPGKQNGVAVRVKYTAPIAFNLE